jgi:N-acetylglucosaminyldiphosphoundecaprenol N-acetyl-beta-D-mannosaminyltransferase
MLGVPMDAWTMDETIAEISERIESGCLTQHVVVNVAKLVQLRRDETLRRSVVDSDIINIDGMGVVWGARVLGHEVPERVAGIDVFRRLLGVAEERGWGVYFLGAKQEVLDAMLARLREQHPALAVSGARNGYFSADEEEDIVRRIRDSGAALLFVAMSTPKKERFVAAWAAELGARFVMGVGGSFDVLAGATKRAPAWVQKAGLEWLYRTMQEPRRMWPRYLDTNTRFAGLLVRERLRQDLARFRR